MQGRRASTFREGWWKGILFWWDAGEGPGGAIPESPVGSEIFQLARLLGRSPAGEFSQLISGGSWDGLVACVMLQGKVSSQMETDVIAPRGKAKMSLEPPRVPEKASPGPGVDDGVRPSAIHSVVGSLL